MNTELDDILRMAQEKAIDDAIWRRVVTHAVNHLDAGSQRLFLLGALFVMAERTKPGTNVTVRNGEERILFDEATGYIRYPNDH